MSVIIGYKNPGESMVTALKRECSESYTQFAFYNKLDPMARGCFNIVHREDQVMGSQCCNAEKTYTCKILLGGPVTASNDYLSNIRFSCSDFTEKEYFEKYDQFIQELDRLPGTHIQNPNRYAAVRIGGKPIWRWSKEGRYHEIREAYYAKKGPGKEITVFSSDLVGVEMMKSGDIVQYIQNKLYASETEYPEFSEQWYRYEWGRDWYLTVDIQFHVSSGTFIRELAETLGKKSGANALVLQITRD